jgi:hypothetical protein
MSIDDAVVESQSTFICRTKLPWRMYPDADWIYQLYREVAVVPWNKVHEKYK